MGPPVFVGSKSSSSASIRQRHDARLNPVPFLGTRRRRPLFVRAYILSVAGHAHSRHGQPRGEHDVPPHTFVHWCEYKTHATLSYTGPRTAAELAIGGRVMFPDGLVY